MIGDLFDSPWKIAIIAVLIIVLFGARKLPVAARELGKSMRILKKEVQGLHADDDLEPVTPVQPSQVHVAPAAAPLQVPAAPPAPDTQAQIDALSKQLADLQRSANTSDSAQANSAQAN
jgi:sec-independent protein translocase protein TatA